MPSFTRAVTAGVLAALGALSADAAAAPCVDRVANCDAGVDQFPDKVRFAYANASTIPAFAYSNTHVDADVVSNALDQTFTYRFVRCGCEDVAAAADGGDGRVVVPVPVAGAFVGDSVIMAMMEGGLESIESVKAVGSVAFVFSPAVRKGVEDGDIAELTTEGDFGPATNVSLLVGREEELGVGVSIVNEFGVDGWESVYGGDTPFVVSAESGERNPLGRAEWIKLFGVLIGKEARAEEQFEDIERRYREISTRAFSTRRRPSLVTNYPTRFDPDSPPWGMPGGEQYISALFRDANVDYKNAADGSKDTTMLTLEGVEDDFGSARVWVNAGRFPGRSDDTIDNLVGDDQPEVGGVPDDFRATFKNMAAVKCGNVWSNSKDITADGNGNNYFEEAPLRPDLVLEDMLEIFHPEVSDKSPEDLKFYYKLGGPGDAAAAAGLGECPYNALPGTAPAGKVFHVTELEIKDKDRFAVEDELAKGEMEPAIAAANDIPDDEVEVIFNRAVKPDSTSTFANVLALADEDAEYDHDAVADSVRSSLNLDASDVEVLSTGSRDTVAEVDDEVDGDDDDSNGNLGKILAGALGGIGFLAIAALVGLCCCLRSRKNRAAQVDQGKDTFEPEQLVPETHEAANAADV